jgi:hypothetical protein
LQKVAKNCQKVVKKVVKSSSSSKALGISFADRPKAKIC